MKRFHTNSRPMDSNHHIQPMSRKEAYILSLQPDESIAAKFRAMRSQQRELAEELGEEVQPGLTKGVVWAIMGLFCVAAWGALLWLMI